MIGRHGHRPRISATGPALPKTVRQLGIQSKTHLTWVRSCLIKYSTVGSVEKSLIYPLNPPEDAQENIALYLERLEVSLTVPAETAHLKR